MEEKMEGHDVTSMIFWEHDIVVWAFRDTTTLWAGR